jgi:hypothetical protein
MTISTTPAYPLPGEEVTLSRTGGIGSYTEYELLSVPSRSTLTTGLLRTNSGAASDTFKPDVQGAYSFRALEYVEYSGAGGSSPTDVAGQARRELRGSQTGTVYACASLELPILTTIGHSATLRLRVHGSTVREAEILKPSTEVARMAALQADVVAALEGLVGVTTTKGLLGEDFVDDVQALATRFNLHAHTEAGVHGAADDTNIPRRQAGDSVSGALDQFNDLWDTIMGHLRTNAGGGEWHLHDDGKNLPVTGKASSLASGVVSLADLRERVYERHRVQVASPEVHGLADDALGSRMSDPLPLTVCIVAYLDALAAESPTAPSGEQQGVADLAHGFGFKLLS